MLPFVLALVALLVALGGGASASGGSGSGSGSDQSFQIQVTECGDSSTSCSSDSAPSQVIESKPAPAQTTTVQLQPSTAQAPRSEVQSYSLKTGKGTVVASNGTVTKTSLQEDARLKAAEHSPLVALPAPSPTVTTIGGAVSVPGLNLFTTDQALAQFTIPPFLMPIYASAGRAYGVPWNVLAAINSIETGFGHNLNISSAGAVGWMQFMPGTWKRWGVDATGDGYADPFNPVDAIFATARYLRASGGATDLSKAVFAYNHAKWYVAEVLKTASLYGTLPAGLVGETTTLAYGHFPLRGRARYGDDFRVAQLAHRHPRGLLIHGAAGAQAIATQAVTVKRILLQRGLARTLTAAKAHRPAAPAPAPVPAAAPIRVTPSALVELGVIGQALTGRSLALPTAIMAAALPQSAATSAAVQRVRKPHRLPSAFGVTRVPGVTVVVRDGAGDTYSYAGLAHLASGIRPGTRLRGGQVVGSLPRTADPVLLFGVKAAGGAAVDPRPLVDGYRLEEAANLYHATARSGPNPFLPGNSGAALARGHYVFPIPAGVRWTPGRVDMGWDIETGSAGVGQPLVAIGDAQILHIQAMGEFGPTWISYRLLDGAAAGRTVFIGHSGPPLVKPGQIVRAGQPIIRIHGGTYGGPVGHFEIGWANADGSNTLAAPHYHEGDVTPEGASFQAFLARLPGTFVNAMFPAGLGGLQPEKVSSKQEHELSQRLDKVVNPRVTLKPSRFAVRVPHRAATALPATHALNIASTAAGAHLIDVDVPAGASGGEAYAIGTVAGAGHRGWARTQTVVLRFAGSRWSIVGAPRNAAGRTVNPKLTALATLAGGRGYAVGAKGAFVRLRGTRTPLFRQLPTKVALADVAAAASGHRMEGVAVGARGLAVRFTGAKAALELVARGATLSAVAMRAGETYAAGVKGADRAAVLYRRGTSWQAVGTDFALPRGYVVRPHALALGHGTVWLAGGLVDMTTGNPQVPFAARLAGGRWATYCPPAPALAPVVELGDATPGACDSTLAVTNDRAGAATDVALTSQGALLATPAGLQLDGPLGFRRAADPTSTPGGAGLTYDHLAAARNGSGWALDAGGAMARIDRARPADATALKPIDAAGAAAHLSVAASPDGRTALAAADGAAAVISGAAAPPVDSGLQLAQVAWATPKTAWAIESSTGSLIRFADDRWSVTASTMPEAKQLSDTLVALGVRSVSESTAGNAGSNLRALGFASNGNGYAVGAGGAIMRFDGSTWSADDSPTSSDLDAVAADPVQAIAGGMGGTILERVWDGGWKASDSASALAAGADVTSVDLMDDGTALAAAGGTILDRGPGADWERTDLQPLGLPATKLRGYRDAEGTLHVLALVSTGSGAALLDGDASGWRPVGDQLPAAVSDFDLDQHTGELWVAARGDSGPVVAKLTDGPGGAWTVQGTG